MLQLGLGRSRLSVMKLGLRSVVRWVVKGDHTQAPGGRCHFDVLTDYGTVAVILKTLIQHWCGPLVCCMVDGGILCKWWVLRDKHCEH